MAAAQSLQKCVGFSRARECRTDPTRFVGLSMYRSVAIVILDG